MQMNAAPSTMPAGSRLVSRSLSRTAACMTVLALTTGKRGVVQSNTGKPMRSILDQYEDNQLALKLRRNSHGNYYRYQQGLWRSVESIERELTKLHYSPTERTPHALLPMPQRQRPRQVATFEGNGATRLLERAESSIASTTQEAPLDNAVVTAVRGEGGDHSALTAMDDFIHGDQSIRHKIISDDDLAGSVLESAGERAREVVQVDLSVNTLALRPHDRTPSEREPASARDLAGSSWSALGLDPLLSHVASTRYGAVPSRLQARLIPALIHEDHNDVLFNGVTGSGKTTALLLAILHGIRTEAAGLNVLVATNTMNAMRLHDTVRALCQLGGGGQLVDRPADDYSWLFLGTYREEHEKYYMLLRRGLHGPHGPCRLLITTADVMDELFFEQKMEFEDFGYLRRVYVDDVGSQITLPAPTDSVEAAREHVRNPSAAELLLGTLHQLPGPHIRSVLQLGLVSADVDGQLKDHLKALCIKPAAHTVVLSPVRVPSTVHCLFSFYNFKCDPITQVTQLIWNARTTIPGRAVIFMPDTCDLLAIRRQFRAKGLNAKLFSEVYAAGSFKDTWKFLVLKESEAFGVDLPLVSHVFIAFTPRTWQSYQHMCGRTGRLGNVGWAYVITDQRDAKTVREIAEDLQVSFTDHVITQALAPVPEADVDRQTRAPTPYGMDPQAVVAQHYEVQAENPDVALKPREFFSKPNVRQQFQMEDYTPVSVQQRSFENASALAKDVTNDPRRALKMQEDGLLDAQLKPTRRLKSMLRGKPRRGGKAPFD